MSRSIRGAYNPDGTLAEDTPRVTGTRARKPDPVPDRLTKDNVVHVYDEEVVWGGSIVSHFGHFLTESVSRLWPILPGGELSGLPVVFATPSRRQYIVDWLKAFGVRTIELPAQGAVRFKRMFVPESAWRLNAWIAPEIRDIHLHARQGLDVPASTRHDVLWLSRSMLNRERLSYDENLLEWLIGKRVKTIYPEMMTLAEQVAAIEASEAVAGIVGSAFHTLLMAVDPPPSLHLCPGKIMSGYVAQDQLLNAKGTFLHALAASEMKLLGKFRSPGIYRLSIPESLRALCATLVPDLLDDSKVASAAYPERWSSRESPIESDIEVAVARVLLDPFSIRARMDLGARFEAVGLERCALEQFSMVANLNEDYAYAPLRAARLLARGGRRKEASEMAKRILQIEPSSKREEIYVEEAKRYVDNT